MNHPIFGKHLTERERRYSQIINALKSGPATLHMLAARLECTPHVLRCYVEALEMQGIVTLAPREVAKSVKGARPGPVPVVYQLAEEEPANVSD